MPVPRPLRNILALGAVACLLALDPEVASALTTLHWRQPADSAPVEVFLVYKGPAPYSGEIVALLLPEPDASGVYSADVPVAEVEQGIPVFVWLTAANGVGESEPSNTRFYPPGCDQGFDADCDGIPDDVPGYIPCASGQVLGCDDNCPWWPNPAQDDTGGIGAVSPPDGIGDACQCGDVSGDGRVSLVDSILIQRSLLSPPTATLVRPDLCDVGGDPEKCDIADAVIVLRAQLIPPTASIQQQCVPALEP